MKAIFREIALMRIFLHQAKNWQKENIGLPEILIFVRNLLIWLQNLKSSPYLLKNFDKYTASLLMFFLSMVINYTFVLISDQFKGDWFKIEGLKSGEQIKSKTFLIRILSHLYKKNKMRIALFISLLDPLLLVLHSRDGHHIYNGIPNKKIWAWFFLSSLFGNLLWILIILTFFNFGIIPSAAILTSYIVAMLLIYKL